MSHRHKVDCWLMALATNKASYIIVLGIVISILPITSTLLQDSYQVRFKQKTVNKKEVPIKHRGSPRNRWAQSIYVPTAFPISFPVPIPIPFPQKFPRVPIPITRPFPSPIQIIPIAAHFLKKGGFGSGFLKQSASISAVGKLLKSISPSLAISAAR